MEVLGDFQNYRSMEIANARFVAALTGRSDAHVAPKAVPRPMCAHDSRYSFTHADKVRCRICDPRTAADLSRERRLPEMIENTQEKLNRLLKEAKRRGIVV